MDLEDVFKLLAPFLFFALSILGRLARRRGGQRKSPPPAFEEPARHETRDETTDEYAPVVEYRFEDDESRESTEGGERGRPGIVFHRTRFEDEEPVSAPARQSTSDTDSAKREAIRQQLRSVFGALGLDLELDDDADEEDEEDEEFESPVEAASQPVARSVVLESLRTAQELDSRRRALVAQANRLRSGSSRAESEPESFRSVSIVRDALVLDAILHRPRWGALPLRRR